jgi:putative oxidoreductase
MQHGFAKLSRGPDAFAAILQAMGVPYSHLTAWLTIVTELLGGVAVLLGACVTIVSVPMTGTGAMFGPVGFEVILLYLACLEALLSAAPGHSPSMDSSASASTREDALAARSVSASSRASTA